MIRHQQLFRHDPDNGVYGDCHRTAIACLLDLHPTEVPHFGQLCIEAEASKDPYDWRAHEEQWLNERGLTQAHINFSGGLDQLFDFMDMYNPNVLYLLGGTSPRGTAHTVICHGGKLEWDPHPDGGGVPQPMAHKVYEVSFLLPLAMKQPLPDAMQGEAVAS
jgi:hypothetical protein